MILPILRYPHPKLRTPAAPVEVFNASLVQLLKNMAETLYAASGIGLAAPQVGVSLRVVVLDVVHLTTDFAFLQVLINPEILRSEGTAIGEEGCLSLPGILEPVTRAEKVWVKYQNAAGVEQELEASGILAVCLQHELDHLRGVVFIEHLSRLKRGLAEKALLRQTKKALR